MKDYEEKEFYGRGPEFSNELQIYQTAGCPVCNKTGYKGRIAIHELLINCDEIRAAIQSHAKVDQIREIAKRNDMLTLKQDGILKIFQGFCDLRSVRAVCMK